MNKTYLLLLLLALVFASWQNEEGKLNREDTDDLMVRIAEIEVEPGSLDAYLSILKEESRASLELEPGVISIFPMTLKGSPGTVRILEIYKDRKAYESHLETPHFKHYKTATSDMVKSLKLIDMKTIDAASIPMIFKKMK